MRPRELLRQPFAVLFAAMVLAYLGVALALPELWLRLAAKEGPIEHAGHLALGGAALLWLWLGTRAAGRARALALGVVAYLLLAGLEEIDWGQVYGVDLGHGLVARWTGGSPNFHNAQHSHSSLATWSVLWMSAPMALFFGLPLLPLGRVRAFWAGFSPVSSRLAEGLSFFGAACLTAVIDGLPLLERRLGYVPRAGSGDPVGGPLGFFQIAFYLAWVLVALRALGELRRGPSAKAPPGVP